MQKKKGILGLFLLSLFVVLLGCGEKKATLTDGREVYVKEDKNEKEQTEETKEEMSEEQLFLVTGLNTEQKIITLKGYREQEETEYSYTGATYVKDKYGNDITMEQIAAGEMVNAKFENNKLKSVQVSDEVFTYGDIHNFTIDADSKTITVGKNSYYYDDVQVFFRNNKISIGEISQWDTICLKGIDKKVYAIQVTNGHGTVVLQNTDVFEGGNITIGNVLSLDIEKDMRIEVPEGTYLLSVANNGYGGNREVTIEPNCETVINLDELKGEGPKSCTINFVIEPDNATLYLNGELVDLSQPLILKYGRYTLSAKAEGYADWKKTLVVNSESANLKIELQTEEEEETEEAEEAEEESTSTGSSSTTSDSGKAQEEAVKAMIEEIRNGTLSTSNSTSAN